MVRALFPGAFDPIHYGHIDIAQRAAKLFDEVIVAVFDRPLKHLLFPPETRINLVRESFADNKKIKVMGYNVLTVEFCRAINAQVIVRGLRVFSDFEYEFRYAIANHHLAPDIETVALITSERHTFLSSTTVREIAALHGDISDMVPPHVVSAVRSRLSELGESHPIVPASSLKD